MFSLFKEIHPVICFCMLAPCHNNATWSFIFMFGHGILVLVWVITSRCFIMLMFYVHDSSTFIYLQLLSCCFVIFWIYPIYCLKPFMTLFRHFYVFLYNKLQLFITHHVHLPNSCVAKDF